jgi:hypothetical protein
VLRCRKRNGEWAYGVLISTLTPEAVLALTATGQKSPTTEEEEEEEEDPTTTTAAAAAANFLLAYVYFYDKRGGGVETAYKEDKQGLGITKRQKKREAAQRMVVYLGTLAHKACWCGRKRGWPSAPRGLGHSG